MRPQNTSETRATTRKTNQYCARYKKEDGFLHSRVHANKSGIEGVGYITTRGRIKENKRDMDFSLEEVRKKKNNARYEGE